MTVKVKTKNKIPQDQRLTLDAIHLKQIKKFQSLQKSIPLKKKEIIKIEEQIKKLQKEADSKKDDFALYFELMDQRRLLEINIQNIEKEITEIEIAHRIRFLRNCLFEGLTKSFITKPKNNRIPLAAKLSYPTQIDAKDKVGFIDKKIKTR